jgi:hypothetical protein
MSSKFHRFIRLPESPHQNLDELITFGSLEEIVA